MNPLLNENIAQLGGYGYVEVGSTNQVKGPFYAIQILADAVFSQYSAAGRDVASDDISAATWKAGMVRYDPMGISSFTLASGTVVAFLKPEKRIV